MPKRTVIISGFQSKAIVMPWSENSDIDSSQREKNRTQAIKKKSPLFLTFEIGNSDFDDFMSISKAAAEAKRTPLIISANELPFAIAK